MDGFPRLLLQPSSLNRLSLEPPRWEFSKPALRGHRAHRRACAQNLGDLTAPSN
jgi:hypothetical protein